MIQASAAITERSTV